MKQPGHLKVACVHCGQHIEFPRELLGTIIDCPDCGLSTPLKIPGITPDQGVGIGERGVFVPRLQDHVPENMQPRPYKITLWHLAAVLFIGALALLVERYEAGSFFGWVALGVLILIYFIPTMLARHKRNATAIMVLNLFLGWTLVGWVVALVWACTVETDRNSK